MRFLLILLLAAIALSHADSIAQSAARPATGVEWIGFAEAMTTAQKTSAKLLVDVYAPWCGWCSKLQQEVYTDAEIQSYLQENFVVTRLNIDQTDDQLDFRGYRLSSSELAMGLGASGTPTTVFIDSDGEYITRLPGFLAAEDFLNVLKFVATDAYLSQTFEEFAGLQ